MTHQYKINFSFLDHLRILKWNILQKMSKRGRSTQSSVSNFEEGWTYTSRCWFVKVVTWQTFKSGTYNPIIDLRLLNRCEIFWFRLSGNDMNYKGSGKVHFGVDDVSLYGTPKEELGPGLPGQEVKQSFLKNQLQALFQPTDNKLAMKLFGSKKALMKERIRQKAAGHWVIHPCSSFRWVLYLHTYSYFSETILYWLVLFVDQHKIPILKSWK